jgi:hypothetical protein
LRPQYINRFELKPDTWVFVPGNESRDFGADLVQKIRRRWNAPPYFFNLKAGGHVAAARHHESSPYIVRLDIERFFDRVTRTKVARSLRAVGISAGAAFEAGRLSTVRKPHRVGFSIPFGFVQSPLLASLVLDRSSLGRALRHARRAGAILSVYVDDILLSHTDRDTLAQLAAEVRDAADTSQLCLSLAKSQFTPQAMAEAFNLHIGKGKLRVNGVRMSQFRAEAFQATAEQLEGYARYLYHVNPTQALAFLDDLQKAGLEVLLD